MNFNLQMCQAKLKRDPRRMNVSNELCYAINVRKHLKQISNLWGKAKREGKVEKYEALNSVRAIHELMRHEGCIVRR